VLTHSVKISNTDIKLYSSSSSSSSHPWPSSSLSPSFPLSLPDSPRHYPPTSVPPCKADNITPQHSLLHPARSAQLTAARTTSLPLSLSLSLAHHTSLSFAQHSNHLSLRSVPPLPSFSPLLHFIVFFSFNYFSWIYDFYS